MILPDEERSTLNVSLNSRILAFISIWFIPQNVRWVCSDYPTVCLMFEFPVEHIHENIKYWRQVPVFLDPLSYFVESKQGVSVFIYSIQEVIEIRLEQHGL